jgi:hypothetical protein
MVSAGSGTFATSGARTMLAALYGELMPHSVSGDPTGPSQDAYSLFYARSAAMDWLTPAVVGAEGGLWGMNEGELTADSDAKPSGLGFFQVVLTGRTQEGVLPVQPFLSCAGDVMARLGMLRLEAIQVLLPWRDAYVGGVPASPSGRQIPGSLLDARNWFADRDPQLRVEARVTLDGGPDPSIRQAAPAIMQWVNDIRQNVFVCDSFSLKDDDHLILWPAPLDGPEAEFAHYRVTFRGMLVAWSLDALGWLAAFLADVSSRNGVSTPLMFTADLPGKRWPHTSCG